MGGKLTSVTLRMVSAIRLQDRNHKLAVEFNITTIAAF